MDTDRLKQSLCVVVASVLVSSQGSNAAGPSVRVPVQSGEISVESDPQGAEAFLDGRWVGRTPLSIRGLASGGHRIRLLKDGYLENARLVDVTAGRSTQIKTRLTRDRGAEAMPAMQARDATRGGLSRWPLLALAAGAGGTALVLLSRNSDSNESNTSGEASSPVKPNSAPLPGTIGVSPTVTGMAGITSYLFGAQSSLDPDGDSLMFAWKFGDGVTASGLSTSHTYASPGTYTVTLDVSDGQVVVTAPSVFVTVGASIAGTWAGAQDPGFQSQVVVALTQNGAVLGGTMTLGAPVSTTVNLTGTVNPTTYPAAVTFTTASFAVTGLPGTFVVGFSGIADATTKSMSGTITDTATTILPPTVSAPATFSR